MLQAAIIHNEQHSLIRLSNESLDSSISGELKAMVDSFFQGDGRNLIMDMSGILSCDSNGLEVLVNAHQLAEEKKGILVLCRLSGQLGQSVKSAQLDSVLNIVPSPEEAVDLVLFNEIENQLRAESGEDEL